LHTPHNVNIARSEQIKLK